MEPDIRVRGETGKETIAVLKRPKFGFSVTTVNQILSEITAVAELVVPSEEISLISSDPPANRVLECAVEAAAEYIVSGDSHLLDLSEYSTIRILSPSQFLR